MIRILVADDDEAIRYTIGQALSATYEVFFADTRASAVEAAEQQSPQVVITDLGLPDGSGLDVLQAVDRAVPVIVLTGNGSLESAVQALRLGAYDYLTKPLEDIDVLRATVQRAAERSRMTEENARLQRAVEQANDFKTRVIKTVAHDFQNTLMGILGFAQLAQMSDTLEEKNQNMEDVITATRSMRDIVENFAVYGRLVTQELRPKTVDVGQAAADVANGMNLNPQKYTVQTPPPGLTVEADSRHVRQIFTQLLGNAVRYTPRGGLIRVEAERTAEGGVTVCVIDPGVGIPKDMQGELFQPFYRAKRSATSEIPGAGLGLSIVRTLVGLHGGRTWIESEAGSGTRACFFLPDSPH